MLKMLNCNDEPLKSNLSSIHGDAEFKVPNAKQTHMDDQSNDSESLLHCDGGKVDECSSSEELPSYQINQCVQRSDSPVFMINFPLSVPSSGAWSQRRALSNNKLTGSLCTLKDSSKVVGSNIFESLGMIDKDISWASSMASPAPCGTTMAEMNTVERATFLPEHDFLNVQPRALFSPHTDDSFGLKPLDFSSGSDEEHESYNTKMRLSDVCEFLKELNVKTVEASPVSAQQLSRPQSPVLQISSQRYKTKVKARNLNIEDNLQNRTHNEGCNSSRAKENVTDSNASKDIENIPIEAHSAGKVIADDSFLNLSFSGIDELCNKSLKNNNVPVIHKEKPTEVVKIFYDSVNMKNTELYDANLVNGVLTSTMLSVDADVSNKTDGDVKKKAESGNKNDTSCRRRGIISFSQLNKVMHEKREGDNKVLKKAAEENLKWNFKIQSVNSSPNLKSRTSNCVRDGKTAMFEPSHWNSHTQYLIDSQVDVTDTQIFKTVEDIEHQLKFNKPIENKYLNCAEELEKDTRAEAAVGESSLKNIDELPTREILSKNKTIMKTNSPLDVGTNINLNRDVLSNMANGDNAVQDTSRNKPTHSLLDIKCNINTKSSSDTSGKFHEFHKASLPKGFRCIDKGTDTCTDTTMLKPVALKPARSHSLCGFQPVQEDKKIKTCLDEEMPESVDFTKERQFTGLETFSSVKSIPAPCGFKTAGGRQVTISEETVNKMKTWLDEEEIGKETTKEKYIESPSRPTAEQFPSVCGFKTAAGHQVTISEEAVKKMKTWLDEEEIGKETTKEKYIESPSWPTAEQFPSMCGFKTAAGHQVTISEETVNKMKTWLDEDKETTIETHTNISSTLEQFPSACGFKTAGGRQVTISEETVNKMKTWLDEEELCNETTKQTFTKSGDGPTADKFPVVCSGKTAAVSKETKQKEEILLAKDELSQAVAAAKVNTAGTCGDAVADVILSNLQEAGDVIRVEIPLECEVADVQRSANNGVDVSELSTEGQAAASYSELLKDEEWEETIPPWLYTYVTSPSFVNDRTEMPTMVSHEDGSFTAECSRYLTTSPVLGTNDRSYRRKRSTKPNEWKMNTGSELQLMDKKPMNTKSNFTVPYKKDSKQQQATKRSLVFDSDVPFKKHKTRDASYTRGRLNETVGEVKEGRKAARAEQESIVRGKQKVIPFKGSHLTKKRTQTQFSLREVLSRQSPGRYTWHQLSACGVKETVIEVTAANAVQFKFCALDFYRPSTARSAAGIAMGDGCSLILDDENCAGVEEFTRAFLASPGVDPKLVNSAWIANHFGWIVWKLANYERSLPERCAGISLSPHNVALQLKYRYDREIDRSERSCLKKILERDDAAGKLMVLCVHSVTKAEDLKSNWTGFQLGMTDGWYSCPVHTDSAMTPFIQRGMVTVGTKLAISGAELVGCDQGVLPLELPAGVHLKISTNSVRRAKWDAKLGYQCRLGCLAVNLNSILHQGGVVGRVDVVIVRVYPVIYIERSEKDKRVFRNQRMELRAASAYQQNHEAQMERLLGEIQQEYDRKPVVQRRLSCRSLSDLSSGEELCQLLRQAPDPLSVQNSLTSSQLESVLSYQREADEKRSKEMTELLEQRVRSKELQRRDVSEVLRVKVLDHRRPDLDKPGLLSVWRPTEDLLTLLTEGSAVSVFGSSPGGSRFGRSVLLNSTKNTQYQQLGSVSYPDRRVTLLGDITRDMQPLFGELDIVGVVVLIKTASNPPTMQTVYLSDARGSFLGIVFWRGTKEFCWEDVLTVGSVVCGSNLIWRSTSASANIPCVFANETTTFCQHPKPAKSALFQHHLDNVTNSLPNDMDGFVAECEELIAAHLESTPATLKFRPRYLNGFAPNSSSTPVKMQGLPNFGGADEPSPIQGRIDRLHRYGEPPPLSPLVLRGNMGPLKKRFKVPHATPSTLGAADSTDSPPMDM